MIKTIRHRINQAVLCILAIAGFSSGAVRIVAALPDMGSIAAYIGGDKVEVSSIAKANSNPHSVEVFPSYMAKVSQAKIYLKSGLGLDQWSDAIIGGSRNNKITVIDCSSGITVLEKPAHVDASMGDVHPFGNPHYWLDPRNGIIIGKNILNALKAVDPSNSAVYESNFTKFKGECESKFNEWQSLMKPLDGRKIITYHSSWAYFADVFHLVIIEHVEPFPGIPPTGKHLAHLVDLIKKEKAVFILQEPYFPDDAPMFLTKQTGIKVFKFSPSCTDVKAGAYLYHFDEIVKQLTTVAEGK
jgi:zinc/manganese transport system substrate-binding protein